MLFIAQTLLEKTAKNSNNAWSNKRNIRVYWFKAQECASKKQIYVVLHSNHFDLGFRYYPYLTDIQIRIILTLAPNIPKLEWHGPTGYIHSHILKAICNNLCGFLVSTAPIKLNYWKQLFIRKDCILEGNKKDWLFPRMFYCYKKWYPS